MTTIIQQTRPFSKYDLIPAGSVMTANIIGPAVRCETLSQVRNQLSYTGVDAAVGVISVQTCESGIEADFVDWPITADMFKVISGDGALNGSGTIDISGGGAGRIDFNITDVHGFLRFKYTYTSDGIGDTMHGIGGAR